MELLLPRHGDDSMMPFPVAWARCVKFVLCTGARHHLLHRHRARAVFFCERRTARRPPRACARVMRLGSLVLGGAREESERRARGEREEGERRARGEREEGTEISPLCVGAGRSAGWCTQGYTAAQPRLKARPLRGRVLRLAGGGTMAQLRLRSRTAIEARAQPPSVGARAFPRPPPCTPPCLGGLFHSTTTPALPPVDAMACGCALFFSRAKHNLRGIYF